MKTNHSVDIPLVFFSAAFFIVLFGLFSKLTFQKTAFVHTSSQIIPTQIKKQKITVPLNYDKPIVCEYQTKESSISAALDENSITAKVTSAQSVHRYVVQGDCLYSWDEAKLKGQKKCGVGNYIPMGKQLLSSGMGSVSSIASMLQKSSSTSSTDFQAVFDSCKNVKTVQKSMFVLPKKVKFE